MMHKLLPRHRFWGMLLAIGLIVIFSVRPIYGATNTSTASFRVTIDQTTNPSGDGNGNGGDVGGNGTDTNHNTGDVDKPDIPNNGQEIHYVADGQNGSSWSKLPQTSVLQTTIWSLLGLSLILIAVIWRQKQSETAEEGYYESK